MAEMPTATPPDSRDAPTARAFADSWNRVGPVYTREQVLEWLAPVEPASLHGREILELGFGNGSLLYHVGEVGPARLAGVELGDTLEQTRRNLDHLPSGMLELHRGDLTKVDLGQFDFVYCIGVLHHLESPEAGFDAVLRHTRPGGRFHCWVYAREGNELVRLMVEPLRAVTSRLPWWVTKYCFALPLVAPYYVYAKLLTRIGDRRWCRRLPLAAYSRWIGQRDFAFFHHVAFDQLVTPRTTYIERERVERWLADPRVEARSAYVLCRNGNSWKLGGRRRGEGEASA